MTGTLVICGSPIGNLGDAPPRLAEALSGADIVYAEDTRRTRQLLAHLEVSLPVRSYFVGNEAKRAEEVVKRLEQGETVALITDAGMPGLSDPGYSAVQAAIGVDAMVTVVPGPSAVTTALAVSGLPSDRFAFEAFLPRGRKARAERLHQLADEPRTIVLFTAKSRLVDDLRDLSEALGRDRPCVVTRELTKAHEEVWRGSLESAAEHWAGEVRPKGEFTLVVGGAPERPFSLDEAVAEARILIEKGESVSDAARRVARRREVSRNQLYEALVGPED